MTARTTAAVSRRTGQPAVRRRATPLAVGLVAAALAAATLTGCGPATVRGQAFADGAVVEDRSAAAFDRQMDLLDERIELSAPFTTGSTTDLTGTLYSHATYGELTLHVQANVAVRGTPASLFMRQNDTGGGYTVDQLHVGGDPWDYLLLGDGYAGVAPTAWVRYPTLYGQLDILGAGAMCYVPGFVTVCDMRGAIDATESSAAGASMRRAVRVEGDGSVFTQTEVTLESVLDVGVLELPDDVAPRLPDAMLAAFVPVSLWQDSAGELRKMEMNGTVPGTDGEPDLVVQLGFEITGTASRDDVPAAPDPRDVTTLDDAGLSDLLDALAL